MGTFTVYWIHSHHAAGVSEIPIDPLYFLSDHFQSGEVRVRGLEGVGFRVLNDISQVGFLSDCALLLLASAALINRHISIVLTTVGIAYHQIYHAYMTFEAEDGQTHMSKKSQQKLICISDATIFTNSQKIRIPL